MRSRIVPVVFAFCLFAIPSQAQVDLNRVLDLGTEMLRQVPNDRQSTQPYPPPQNRGTQSGTLQRSQTNQPTQPSYDPTYQSRSSVPRLSRSAILQIQQHLRDLGYAPGPIDGIAGGKTRRALANWERDRGLPVTGQASHEALRSLRMETAGAVTPSTGSVGTLTTEQAALPSFDCARASAEDERAICSSPDLAVRDRALDQTYRGALETADPNTRQSIIEDQRIWLSARRSCGANVGCLTAMMDARTASLGAFSGSGASSTQLGAGLGSTSTEIPTAGGLASSVDHSQQALNVQQADGLVWVGDRIAITLDHVQADLPESVNRPLDNALWRVIRSDYPIARLSDAEVVGFISDFDEDMQREIAVRALRRPLTDREIRRASAMSVAGRGLEQVILPDPFATKRAVDEIRALLPQEFERERLTSPVPLRVYCNGRLERYDLATATFPIKTECDGPQVTHISRKFVSLSETPMPMPADRLPTSLHIPFDQAEALQERLSRLSLFSFQTEMMVDWRLTEAGMVVNVSYAPPDHFVVHEGRSPTEIAYTLGGPPADRPIASATGEKTWHLSRTEDLVELANLGGPARSLPFDGRQVAWPDTEPLGRLVMNFTGSLFGTRPEDANNRTVALLRGPSNSMHHDTVRTLAEALHLPLEYIEPISVYGISSSASAIILVLPDRHDRYSITAPADKYARRQLSARTVFDVTSVHAFEMPDQSPPAIVITADPIEGSFTEFGQDGAVIERFDIKRATVRPEYDLIEFPPRYDLAQAIGNAYGVDVYAILQHKMRHPKGLSSIEEQERFEELFAASEAAANQGAHDFWLVGTVRLGSYDPQSNAFPFNQLNVNLPETLRKLDVEPGAVRTDIVNQQVLLLEADRAAAQALTERWGTNAILPIRVLVRPIFAQESSYGDLRVRGRVIFGEILDPRAVVSIDDPSRVFYRFGSRPAEDLAPGDNPTTKMTRDDAIAFLTSKIDQDSRYVLVRRNGSGPVTRVLGDYGSIVEYDRIVKAEALDFPLDYGSSGNVGVALPAEAADVLRNDDGAAFIVNVGSLQQDDGSQSSQTREMLISLAREIELKIEEFPPKREIRTAGVVTPLDALIAGNPREVVLRRRDNSGPITVAYTSKSDSFAYSSPVLNMVSTLSKAKELGYAFEGELPRNYTPVELVEIANHLREESNAVAILTPDSLRKIYNKISDLDLVARQFPLEEVSIGLVKDHTDGAESFAILGVSGGMDRSAATTALTTEFGQDVRPGNEPEILIAGGGDCSDAVSATPGDPSETGIRCIQVTFEEDAVKKVALRQVVSGDIAEAVIKALKDRFGWTPFMTETRYLEKAGKRISFGWGSLVASDRSALDRVDAKFPPTALEAVVWLLDGLTTIYVQLDDVPTVAEVKAETEPKIKF